MLHRECKRDEVPTRMLLRERKHDDVPTMMSLCERKWDEVVSRMLLCERKRDDMPSRVALVAIKHDEVPSGVPFQWIISYVVPYRLSSVLKSMMTCTVRCSSRGGYAMQCPVGSAVCQKSRWSVPRVPLQRRICDVVPYRLTSIKEIMMYSLPVEITWENVIAVPSRLINMRENQMTCLSGTPVCERLYLPGCLLFQPCPLDIYSYLLKIGYMEKVSSPSRWPTDWSS